PIANCEVGGFGRAGAFSKDGSMALIILPDDHTIEVRRISDFSLVKSMKLAPNLKSLAWSPDGRSIAISYGRSIALVDFETGRSFKYFSCPSFPFSFQYSPNGERLMACCRDGTVRLFDLTATSDGSHIEPDSILLGHASMVISGSWHPTKPLLATCSMDGKSRLWDLRSSKSILQFDSKCTNFSRDGRWLGIEGGRMAVNLSKSLQTFDQTDTTIELPINVGFYPRGGVTSEIDYWVSMPNHRLMIGQNYFRAVFRDPASDQSLADFAVPGCWFRFSDDGRWLYASSQLLGFCRLPVNRTETDDAVTIQIGPPELIHRARGGAFALAGDLAVITPFLASGLVLNLAKPTPLKPLSRLRVHPYTFWSDISPDGKYTATGTMKASDVRVFDAISGQLVKTLSSETAAPWFSPDGERLIVAENARYTVYEVGSWRVIKRFETVAGGIWPGSLAFSADGQLLALEMGSQIRLFDATSYDPLASFQVPSDQLIESIGFSGNGRFLVSGGGDQDQTHIWDLAHLRSQLRSIGLDWSSHDDLQTRAHLKPMRLELDLGKLTDTTRTPSYLPFQNW
ncbi:MAG: WD40 repeat domain-containing protein, partial [Planctomycetota bacterium]